MSILLCGNMSLIWREHNIATTELRAPRDVTQRTGQNCLIQFASLQWWRRLLACVFFCNEVLSLLTRARVAHCWHWVPFNSSLPCRQPGMTFLTFSYFPKSENLCGNGDERFASHPSAFLLFLLLYIRLAQRCEREPQITLIQLPSPNFLQKTFSWHLSVQKQGKGWLF